MTGREHVTGECLEDLLRLVSDGGTGCREEALSAILALGMEEVYPGLEDAVRNNEDADLRNGAMETFVAFGVRSIHHLVELLKDDDHEVRNFSAVMLGDIGSREALGPLIGALCDHDATVRHGAAEALGKIGDLRAELPLTELARGDSWDRFYALAALKSLRRERQ